MPNLPHLNYEPLTLQPQAAARGANEWWLLRRAARVTDKLVLNDTRAWLRGLPYSGRPVLLTELFPRIVNELCATWHDTSTTSAFLSLLLQDQRGGRQGFPPLVHAELEELQRLANDRQRTRRRTAQTRGLDGLLAPR